MSDARPSVSRTDIPSPADSSPLSPFNAGIRPSDNNALPKSAVIVAEAFLPTMNGVTNSVLHVLRSARERGIEVTVIAPGAREPLAETPSIYGFDIVRVPTVQVPLINSLPIGVPTRTVLTTLHRLRPDVIHIASPFVLGAAGAWAARRLHIPTVAIFQTDVAAFASAYHLGPLHNASWRWIRTVHNWCNRTLAPSSASIVDLRHHGIREVYHWGRGVDAELFAPQKSSSELRQLWLGDGTSAVLGEDPASWRDGDSEPAHTGAPFTQPALDTDFSDQQMDADFFDRSTGSSIFGTSKVSEASRLSRNSVARHPVIVGFVGRLASEKSVERLAVLDADPRYHVVIVGDGPERDRLRRALPHATFTGALRGEALARAYASFDVFVHPGERETFCQAIQEALASGVPVIAPRKGGPIDLVGDGVTGRLLPPGDAFAKELPAAVELCMENRAAMAQAARMSVAHRTWPALCDELFNHWAAVCQTA